MELARAKVIADVAQAIINSAKVECDYIELTGQKGSGFIPHDETHQQKPALPRLVK